MGYRYRKNYSKLTEKPDIVFTKSKVVVFCDSEFWHGKDWAERNHQIKSNRDYCIPKIENNIKRDKKMNDSLKEQGYLVLRFLGKEIKKDLSSCARVIISAVESRRKKE